MEASTKKPSGLLHVHKMNDHFTLTLYSASGELDDYVEHYWIVNWDLRGREPYLSENLPHPSVHLVVEPGVCRVVGIVKEKFSFELSGRGFVFGVKFRPGAFYPLTGVPVRSFTGRSIAAVEVFGPETAEWEAAVRAAESDSARIALAERFLRGRLPRERDETAGLVRTIVDVVAADRTIATVDAAAQRFRLSTRMLQRMFGKYVGISPKWVIGRYRLLEAADRLAEGQSVDWAQLAARLGYYDQSHLIKDFKSIVGLSPEEYIRKNTKTGPG
ncbi:helix-turn-helix domain-containing protein [Paenibacillus humicola]|uniref:helix-turn-helix domain-containing protein n=1 Tax=Paenibacillus humicola TaxID=3110540 RepID=UPI00237A0E44|nr:helix-turn-helix domain-containing protein [Paenibacillus humicola]